MQITEQLLKEVAEKSLQNAQSLIEDAELLKQNNRIQRTYTLYQLAMEEVGKSVISFVLIVSPDGLSEGNQKMYREEFFEHRRKTKRSGAMDILVVEVLYQGEVDNALSFLESSFKESEKELNNRKNYSLYTSVIENNVKRPDEVITKDMVNHIWFRTISRFNAAKAFVETGLKNWEALRKYMKEQAETGNVITPERYAEEFWAKISKKKESSG